MPRYDFDMITLGAGSGGVASSRRAGSYGAKVATIEESRIGGRHYTAETILIATGGHPTVPDIPGIEHVISSNEALDLPALPRRIVIVGGGYIAVEFAGIFRGLGSEVVELIRREELLYGFDDDMRVAL